MMGERLRAPRPLRRINLLRPADCAATFFGAGLSPLAPGTVGSVAALPAAWGLLMLGGPWLLAGAAVIAFAVGTWASEAVVRRTGTDDPGLIVIDEVAGQWLTLVAVPLDPLWFGAGFVLFRLFDIVKPWPASWADRSVKGGFGVMLDDAIAGLYALALLAAVRFLLEGGM